MYESIVVLLQYNTRFRWNTWIVTDTGYVTGLGENDYHQTLRGITKTIMKLREAGPWEQATVWRWLVRRGEQAADIVQDLLPPAIVAQARIEGHVWPEERWKTGH